MTVVFLWVPILRRIGRWGVLLSLLSICLSGCSTKFLDPTQIGRFRPVPAVNVILDSLGVAEEISSTWEGAEEPRPIDVIAFETDYVFARGDVVGISIFELQQEGVMSANNYTITETGKISIPEVGVIEVAGLTESQLEEEIRQILSPSILKDPSITIALLGSQHRTFSILGAGVPKPGRYGIPRYDFRMTDALAEAGGIGQFNTSYIYVSRSVTGKEVMREAVEPEVAEPEEPEQLLELEREMMEIIAPRARHKASQSGEQPCSENRLVIASAEMITDKELAEAVTNGQQEEGRIEWIFQDGKWVPVQVGRPWPDEPVVKAEPKKIPEPLKERVPVELDWDEIEAGVVQARLIKIPVDRLLGGDLRYNIMIRPGDTVHVPVDIIGEFSIMGNVNSTGFINITGRPITLKMAIAAAGGLGPLGWPKRCEVIRRIGKNREEIVAVDLDKIARGEQPDFFIKPNDLINVGTHPTARWRAAWRNAFYASYGIGFSYSRNFAYDYYYGL